MQTLAVVYSTEVPEHPAVVVDPFYKCGASCAVLCIHVLLALCLFLKPCPACRGCWWLLHLDWVSPGLFRALTAFSTYREQLAATAFLELLQNNPRRRCVAHLRRLCFWHAPAVRVRALFPQHADSALLAGEGLYVVGTISIDNTSTVHCSASLALCLIGRQPALKHMRQVVDVVGNCMRDRYDWLVKWTYFLGDVCWLPAVVCLYLDAMNHEYPAQCAWSAAT